MQKIYYNHVSYFNSKCAKTSSWTTLLIFYIPVVTKNINFCFSCGDEIQIKLYDSHGSIFAIISVTDLVIELFRFSVYTKKLKLGSYNINYSFN